MMMVSEMANQKRRSHYDPFSLSPKRLKTGSSASNSSISSREKKDKIGERVAALQQLVSPFGKVQVLSAPYLHSTTSSTRLQEGKDLYSLKNRGLCLMPVATTVLIARSNGADIWAPITK